MPLEDILTGQHDDIVNWEIHQGQVIDINTAPEIEAARKAAERIYADAGHTIGADELKDLENRIRGGQSLAEIVANTFDDAQRRFVAEDTPESRAAETPGHNDAQANAGARYAPTNVMMEQLVTGAREVADLQDGWPAVSHQMSPPTNTPRTNFGPAGGAYGGGAVVYGGDASGGSAFPWGLILIGVAVLAGGYFLLRKK